MTARSFSLLLPVVFLSACSAPAGRQVKVYQAGEKAVVEKLTYTVVDTQIQQRLGDEPNTRLPENRFYIVSLAVTSGNNSEVAIPEMALVDDSGKVYNELPDGAGVAHWLGVVRHVAPAQTERGTIVFDSPAAHYKLRLTNETDDADVYIDMPLSFVHEQMSNSIGGGSDSDAAAPPPAGKK